jgi:hypothetical protein
MRLLSLALALLLGASAVAVAWPVATAATTASPATTASVATASQADTPCAGTVEAPASGTTVVSVQGARFGDDGGKTNGRLVAFGPRGQVKWVHESADEVVWSYDVDPLENGNLFVVGTFREGGHGKTLFFEFDPRAQERLWTARLNVTDTHDADMIDRHRIAVAHMRAYNASSGENEDGLLVYNRTSDEVERSWRFDEDGGYPDSVGGPTSPDEGREVDWSHVNDVDRVGENRYMLSPRNFDQVVVVDLETGEVELQLGEDGDHATMKRQHNPQYLESSDGAPTILVADSENNRIVEYERDGDGERTNGSRASSGRRSDGGWTRTWELGSGESFAWPRDADRLPNGNTLVADSRNDRVLEVAPDGTVVWEVYAPWLVYDVERVRYGDEAYGHDPPTIADMNASGQYRVENAPLFETGAVEACDEHLQSVGPDEIREVTTATDTSTPTTPTPPADDDVTLPGFGVQAGLAAFAGGSLVLLRSRGR